MKKIILISLLVLLIVGCSPAQVDEINENVAEPEWFMPTIDSKSAVHTTSYQKGFTDALNEKSKSLFCNGALYGCDTVVASVTNQTGEQYERGLKQCREFLADCMALEVNFTASVMP